MISLLKFKPIIKLLNWSHPLLKLMWSTLNKLSLLLRFLIRRSSLFRVREIIYGTIDCGSRVISFTIIILVMNVTRVQTLRCFLESILIIIMICMLVVITMLRPYVEVYQYGAISLDLDLMVQFMRFLTFLIKN